MEKVIRLEECGERIGVRDNQIHNAIIIPHKTTNGDIMKTMFPSIKVRYITGSHIGITFKNNQDYITEFELDWWNTPFDEGVEVSKRMSDYNMPLIDLSDNTKSEDDREKESKYCDRNICISNEYAGIECDKCKVMAERDDYIYTGY